eukprot:1598399-Rhodomonas_salina.1
MREAAAASGSQSETVTILDDDEAGAAADNDVGQDTADDDVTEPEADGGSVSRRVHRQRRIACFRTIESNLSLSWRLRGNSIWDLPEQEANLKFNKNTFPSRTSILVPGLASSNGITFSGEKDILLHSGRAGQPSVLALQVDKFMSVTNSQSCCSFHKLSSNFNRTSLPVM